MLEIELIIFDLDGTLIDSRKDIASAVNFTLKKVNLPAKGEPEISSYIGMGVEDLIRKSLGQGEGDIFLRAKSIFEEYYRKHSVDNSVLYPGVKEILEYFKDKKKVIVTNRNYEFAESVLKSMGIFDFFEDIAAGDDASCMKPSPCPLERSLAKLVIDKRRAIIVGDMHIDVLAGKRAGIFTCAVTYGIGSRQDIIEAGPDYIIDDLLSLKNIIE